MWNTTQTYQCAPSVAWRELGRPPLSPRLTRRLTMATNELAALDHALREVTRRRGPKDGMPDPEDILFVAEAEGIYNEREQPTWDAIAAEIERETGEKIEPYRGEGSLRDSGAEGGEAMDGDEMPDGGE